MMSMDNENSPSCDRSHRFEQWALAVNPSTPGHVLHSLVDGAPTPMIERIAENPNATTALLTQLASHACPEVRAAVAENSNTPQQIVFDLAQDECLDVRYGIAENPHMPLVVLDMLAHDENPYVAHRARLTIHRVQFVPRTPLPMPARQDDESQMLQEGRGC
jgi:hypothetical protein